MAMLYKQDPKRYNTSLRRVSPRFTTRTGRKVKLRLLRTSDAPLLVEFFRRMSPETRRRRFHTGLENISDEFLMHSARELANVDNTTVAGAVIALSEIDGSEQIVGSVRLARPLQQPTAPEAEAAIVIRDDFQGQGLGTEMMRRLVLLAKQMKVKTIVAIFQPDNEDAIRIFREINLPYTTTIEHGETILRLEMPAELQVSEP